MLSSKLKMIAHVAAALGVLVVVGAAKADPGYDRNGFYAGAGLGLGFPQYTGVPSDFETGIGFDVWGGYRFMPNFAVETQLEFLDRLDANSPDVEGQELAWTTNLKVYLLTGRFQPFAFGGIGLGYAKFEGGGAESSDTSFLGRVGLGFDFYLMRDLSLQVSSSYVRPTGSLEQFDYVSLLMGAQYRF